MPKSETVTSLNAELAELRKSHEHLEREWDLLLSETVTLHDYVRQAHGTGKLLETYLSETIAVMQSLGGAQESQVLKNLFYNVVSRLSRQQEACQRSMAGLRASLESLEKWKGQLRT